MPQLSYPQACWPAAGPTSSPVRLAGVTVCGLIVPAAFTGTSITFQACDTPDGTYSTVKDATGSAVACVVAGAGYTVLPPATLAGLEFVRLVSTAAEAAGRVVKIAAREAA